MNRLRLVGFALASAAVIGTLLGPSIEGYQPRPIERIPERDFTAITGPPPLPTPSLPGLTPDIREPSRKPLARPPAPPQPRPAAVARQVAPVATKPPTPRYGASVTGFATWYCLPGQSVCPWMAHSGNYAAAGPALRHALGAHWRGRTVSVCKGTKCVRVKLIDWCACGGNHVIDLFADVMVQFVGGDSSGRPLRGGFAATVRW